MSWDRWKGDLAAAVLISIAGNVTHALLVAPTVYGWGAAVAASIAPVFLFWHTHNLITAPEGSRRGDWVGVAVISMIALGAFAVSFMGLRELLTTFGFAPAIAVILPLVVDVTIAGASWELMRERHAEASADRSLIRADHPDDQAISPEITEPISADRTTDIPMIGAGQGLISADHLADQPLIGEADVAPVEAHAGDTTSRGFDTSGDHQVIAALISATGRTTQPISVISAVLAARAEGKGQKAAGLAAGVAQGTVRSIEKLRDEVAA